jgi:hypothetical protein
MPITNQLQSAVVIKQAEEWEALKRAVMRLLDDPRSNRRCVNCCRVSGRLDKLDDRRRHRKTIGAIAHRLNLKSEAVAALIDENWTGRPKAVKTAPGVTPDLASEAQP